MFAPVQFPVPGVLGGHWKILRGEPRTPLQATSDPAPLGTGVTPPSGGHLDRRRHTLTAAWRPFWLSCWSDFHFDWLDHPSWPDPAGIDLAFRWERSRTRSSETTHALGKQKPAETPVFSTRQAFRQGSSFGSMTNPTDAGGENPTIRDVSPPSDTQAATVVTHPGSRLLFRSGRLGHVHSSPRCSPTCW